MTSAGISTTNNQQHAKEFRSQEGLTSALWLVMSRAVRDLADEYCH